MSSSLEELVSFFSITNNNFLLIMKLGIRSSQGTISPLQVGFDECEPIQSQMILDEDIQQSKICG